MDLQYISFMDYTSSIYKMKVTRAVIRGADLVHLFPSATTKMTIRYLIENKRKIEPNDLQAV